MPVITLPDGSHRSFAEPVTVHDVAADIGAGLAKAALAGKVNGKLVDTSHLIENDTELAIVTERDEDGVAVRVWISAQQGRGLDLLAQAIAERLGDDIVQERIQPRFIGFNVPAARAGRAIPVRTAGS